MGIRILTFTTLFPDSSRPAHGVFVENRLRHLLAGKKVESRVMAPVPWFPSKAAFFGSYARYAAVPRKEYRNGIVVLHPRYPLIPKVGMGTAPFLMAMALLGPVQRCLRSGYSFELIDAHYFYPDGVAAVMLGKWLGKPVVVTARGTDINLIPQYRLPRRMIRWAARNTASIITVCQALKDELVRLGIDGAKIRVLRNGVDLKTFQPPQNREALRKEWGVSGRLLLSVGGLISRKGHDLIIRSLSILQEYELMIVGQGPEEHNLRNLAKSIGVTNRVRFMGQKKHESLAQYYGAADALILASSREGWANVLLESMACGTPVVATKVWGTPEILTVPEAGFMIDDRTSEAIAAGVSRLFSNYPDRQKTRKYAERFSWDETTAGQERLFGEILDTSL